MTHELMNYDFCESYDYTPKTNELKDKIKDDAELIQDLYEYP